MQVERRVFSFDLDGTLVAHEFSQMVWRVGIPELVAKSRNWNLEEARRWVFQQYNEVGEGSIEWYDISYWYRRFGLEGDWRTTMERFRHIIRLYPEVYEVLERLGQYGELVIVSNAAKEFIHMEMEATGLDGRFSHIFSATSDFGQVKKTPSFYLEVCRRLGIDPCSMIHVGDHLEFDYLVPRGIGIQAYFVDRDGQAPADDPNVVSDLMEFALKCIGE